MDGFPKQDGVQNPTPEKKYAKAALLETGFVGMRVSAPKEYWELRGKIKMCYICWGPNY